MAADTTDTTTAPPAEGASVDQKLAAVKDEILTAVREMIAPLREGGSAQQSAQRREEQHLDRPTDLAAQIDAAVSKVLAGKDAEQQQAARDAKVDQVIAAAEKPPMERKRSHRVMGWGEPPS
jgi:hypothetical protein